MEEDCRLSEAIINEYRGLNLSHPPRLNWRSSADAALAALDSQGVKPGDLQRILVTHADLDHIGPRYRSARSAAWVKASCFRVNR